MFVAGLTSNNCFPFCSPQGSCPFALVAFELLGDPEQRAVDHDTVVAGQVHDPSFHDEAAKFDQMPRALAAFDLPCAHIMPSPCGLMPVARRLVAPERRPCCGQLPVQFGAPVPERTRPHAWPMPLRGLLRLGQHDQRAGQFIGAERVSPRGDDELAKLLYLAALEVTSLVLKCLQFGIKVPWLAHRRLHQS